MQNNSEQSETKLNNHPQSSSQYPLLIDNSNKEKQSQNTPTPFIKLTSVSPTSTSRYPDENQGKESPHSNPRIASDSPRSAHQHYLNSLINLASSRGEDTEQHRQAMQLALLQHQKQAVIKQLEKGISNNPGGGSPTNISDLRSSPLSKDQQSEAFAAAMAAAASSSALPFASSNAGGPSHMMNPQQVQQLLQQQILSPQQLQNFMQQQHLVVAHQQQAQIQEFYRHQQKQLQDLHLQISTARQAESSQRSREPFGDHNNNNNSHSNSEGPKPTKPEEMQQQIMQQLVQMQLQQQQQQQQALQQQGLAAAAAAFAQGRTAPAHLPSELQQLWKQMADNAALQAAMAATGGAESKEAMSGAAMPYHALLALRESAKNLANADQKNYLAFNGSTSKRSSRETSPVEKPPSNPLYSHGVCKWPGCDVECSDMEEFQRHMSIEHKLDDKSTAQCRVQMQVVEQLEKQVSQEKERMKSMMAHLHMEETNRQEETDKKRAADEAKAALKLDTKAATQALSGNHGIPPLFSMHGTSSSISMPSSPNGFPHNMLPTSISHSPPALTPHYPGSAIGSMQDSSSLMNSRRRHSNHVPISTELSQNQEFYKNADVRPPYTYASLIRQAIVENPDHQLTLNEIYNWFQTKFAYFRRNTATWKSAIRTNLSLHNCFKRQENAFGSYWTVDDGEFRRGRHLKRGRPRKYEEDLLSSEEERSSKSPIMRNRIETPTNPCFYGNLTSSAMQMALSEQSAFNPALFAGQNHLIPPNFVRRGMPALTSADERRSPQSVDDKRTESRKRSLSPQSKRRSSDDRSGFDEAHRNYSSTSITMVMKRERKDDYENYNGRSPSRPESESTPAEYSPGRTNTSNNNNVSDRLTPSDGGISTSPSGAVDMSRTSPSNRFVPRDNEPTETRTGSDEDLENEQNINSEIAQQRTGLISARGSFTMLHDRSSE